MYFVVICCLKVAKGSIEMEQRLLEGEHFTTFLDVFLFQGVGGTVQFPKNFLKKAFEMVNSNGGVCISDEVISGWVGEINSMGHS